MPARREGAFAQGRNASVTEMRLERVDDGVYLSAQVSFELPPVIEEVLDKGIAIFFVAEATVVRERWYWFDQKLGQAVRYMRLAFQPLTRRWRLNISPVPFTTAAGLSLNQNFDTLAEALASVRNIARLRLADAGELREDQQLPVSFQFRLDTTQLPRPFQIGAVGQADWNISAERIERLALERIKP